MDSPSLSRLEQPSKAAREDQWDRFVRQYAPLLSYWARRLGLQDQDADDLVQEVLILIVRKLPKFQYHSQGSFRGWMRAILINKWRDRRERRKAVPLQGNMQPQAPGDSDNLEEREHQLYILGRALRLMASDFQPATWQAFWEIVVGGRPAAQVAAGLGITVDAVYHAKARVLRRLRQDLQGLMD
jgi:RNA polymerase sigma-70 factor (ECF subfamily)